MNYLEPTKGAKVKLIALFLFVLAINPISNFLWGMYSDWTKSLPECDEIFWLERGLNFISLLLAMLSILAFREAYLIIKYKQFPYPGAKVYVRTKIRKGLSASIVGIKLTILGLFVIGVGIGISYVFSLLKASGAPECG